MRTGFLVEVAHDLDVTPEQVQTWLEVALRSHPLGATRLVGTRLHWTLPSQAETAELRRRYEAQRLAATQGGGRTEENG